MAFFQFVTLGDPNDERLCFLDSVVKGLEAKDYCFRFGDPVAAFYPKDAKLFLSKAYPGTTLTDHLGNMKGMIVASKRLRVALEKHCPGASLEILPFTLFDHRKRPCSSDYAIVNPLGGFACVDQKASLISYKASGKVSRIDRLVLDPRQAAQAPQLFRVDVDLPTYIVGPTLAAELQSSGLTNVVLTEVAVSGT